MARTPSSMVALDTPAPPFSLPEPRAGRRMSLDDLRGRKALLVMFICNHCPYVKHVRDELVRLGRDYAGKDLAIVAISANDATSYPDDAPEKIAEEAKDYAFPYLYDETQDVARAYQAACTPDFFLYGPERRLLYRGQLDDSRPGNGVPVSGRDLRAAIDEALAGRRPSTSQKPSLGCNIKWRA
jgi:peroxiredoxin